jgi:hypothetical protein
MLSLSSADHRTMARGMAAGRATEGDERRDADGETDEPATMPVGSVRAVAALRRSSSGGSGSFLVRADDGERYWCKVLNNPQGSELVPINDQVVARLGQRIGVAVPEPRLVEIPQDLAGWEFRPGFALEAGFAHGGRAIEPVVETHQLSHRTSADNAARHAGFFALHDWLGGSDPQWLIATNDGDRYYSHDHGHYFWGPGWTPESLRANIDNPAPLEQPTDGLDATELVRLADELERLDREEIAAALANLPETGQSAPQRSTPS